MLDRDRALRRHAVSAFGQDLHVGELGHELRERVVEGDPALLDQDHHRDARHRLGHRVDAEDVVPLQGVAGRGVPRPGRLPVDDLPPARHHRHHRGQPAVVDVDLHRGDDAVQRVRGHPDRAGGGDREPGVRLGVVLRERGRREHRRNHPGEPDRDTCRLTSHERLPASWSPAPPRTDPRCTHAVPARGWYPVSARGATGDEAVEGWLGGNRSRRSVASAKLPTRPQGRAATIPGPGSRQSAAACNRQRRGRLAVTCEPPARRCPGNCSEAVPDTRLDLARVAPGEELGRHEEVARPLVARRVDPVHAVGHVEELAEDVDGLRPGAPDAVADA